MRGFDGPRDGLITEVAYFSMDVGGNKQQEMYAYIVPRIDGEDLILGLPWLYHQGVSIIAHSPLGVTYSTCECNTRANVTRNRSAAMLTPTSPPMH